MKACRQFICFAFFFFSAWSVAPAPAVTLQPGDSFQIALSGLNDSGLGLLGVFGVATFSGSPFDPFILGDGFRASLFDSSNNLRDQVSVAATSLNTVGPNTGSFALAGNPLVANTGHIVIDQIVGNFDLASILLFGVKFTIPVSATNFVTISGSDIDVVPEAAATPLPAALPSFAAGLIALGWLSWRRKRKTSTP